MAGIACVLTVAVDARVPNWKHKQSVSYIPGNQNVENCVRTACALTEEALHVDRPLKRRIVEDARAELRPVSEDQDPAIQKTNGRLLVYAQLSPVT